MSIWQTETEGKRLFAGEQCLPPPILIAVILLIPFAAENFALEQSNAVVTFLPSLLVPTLGGPVSLL